MTEDVNKLFSRSSMRFRSCKKSAMRIRSAIAILLFSGLAGCTQSLPENESDAAISSRVRSAFAEAGIKPGYPMHVRTTDGAVWLSGYASNDAEQNQAIAIATSTEGVKSVENHLEMMPPPGAAPWPRGR
jgi:osmotically-inducible protein OsmY